MGEARRLCFDRCDGGVGVWIRTAQSFSRDSIGWLLTEEDCNWNWDCEAFFFAGDLKCLLIGFKGDSGTRGMEYRPV